jgi:hypothetical protein
MNIRPCKECGKMVDFDEPWCDHETMEESGLRNFPQAAIVASAYAQIIDDAVDKAAIELGVSAGKAIKEKIVSDLEKE